MGMVCVTEKAGPVKRRVTLKRIKSWMDSAQIGRCFEAKRQALAVMDQAHVAPILDACSVDSSPSATGRQAGRHFMASPANATSTPCSCTPRASRLWCTMTIAELTPVDLRIRAGGRGAN